MLTKSNTNTDGFSFTLMNSNHLLFTVTESKDEIHVPCIFQQENQGKRFIMWSSRKEAGLREFVKNPTQLSIILYVIRLIYCFYWWKKVFWSVSEIRRTRTHNNVDVKRWSSSAKWVMIGELNYVNLPCDLMFLIMFSYNLCFGFQQNCCFVKILMSTIQHQNRPWPKTEQMEEI